MFRIMALNTYIYDLCLIFWSRWHLPSQYFEMLVPSLLMQLFAVGITAQTVDYSQYVNVL
jgi:hypothetical protein